MKCCRTSSLLFSLIVVTLALVITHSSSSADEKLLSRGTPMSIEISPDQTQIIDLAIDAHQYAHISINKGDLRLYFSLQNPDGHSILEGNSNNYETVELSLITDSTGLYRLTLHSLERGASNRQFVVVLDTLRRATSDDVADASASQAFATASQFRSRWTDSWLHAAVEKYKEAASRWETNRDWLRTANALAEAAEVHFILGEYRQSLEYYEQATRAAKKAKDATLGSLCLSQAARAQSLLGAADQALQLAQQSLTYYSATDTVSLSGNTKHAYGAILGYIGEVYFATGDLMRAGDYLERSEKLLTETGDRDGAARSRLFLGYVAVTTGDRERAMSQFTETLTDFRKVNDRSGEGLALTAIGTGYTFRHDDEAAMTLHREAREIFREIGDQQSEAITLNGIAQAYQNLHEYDLALKHYQQALQQFQESGSLDFATTGLCLIGQVYSASGDSKQALAYYEKCAAASRATGKTRLLAYAMDFIAATYAQNGRRPEALDRYNKLLHFYGKINDRRGQALTLNNLGDLYLAWGDVSKALEFYGRALPVSKQAGESGVEMVTLYNLAKAERMAGMLDPALTHIKQSIDLIEGLRSNLASPNLRSAYFAGYRQHYDLYIELLMRLDQERPGKGYAATALLASENSRARSLREMLAELGTDIRQGLDEATLKRERELQQLLSAQAQDQPALKSKEQASSNKQDLDLLRAEYEEIQAKIRHHNPHYESLLQPAPQTITELQSTLEADTLLLEYSLGPEQSYLWAVTNSSLNGYKLPSKAIVEAAALEHYRLLTTRQHVEGDLDQGYQARVEEADKQLDEKANDLSRLLLAPAAQQLSKKRILIVAEGALQYTPFDALPIPGGGPGVDLMSKHELVIVPSVSTLAAIRADRRPRNTSSNVVAVFADPVFTASDDRLKSNPNDYQITPAEYSQSDNDSGLAVVGKTRSGLNRLAYTSEEAERIRRAVQSGAWVVEGFDATRETALNERTGTYKIVHFATHGLINAEHPELSGIVLSMRKPDGSVQNGFLQLHDIYRLRLNADLTVLSACNTALGKDLKGEGLIGLTRGFMYAGSRSVVASLWEVDDRATAVLMENFYSGMFRDGLTPAAALQAAKEAVRKQPGWQHPYFWAGFVLQGEYNEPITAKTGLSFLPKFLISMGVAALAFLVMSFLGYRLRASSTFEHG